MGLRWKHYDCQAAEGGVVIKTNLSLSSLAVEKGLLLKSETLHSLEKMLGGR